MSHPDSEQHFLRRIGEGRPSAIGDLAAGKYGYHDRLLDSARQLIGARLRRHYHADDAVQSVYRALCAALLVVNDNRQFHHRGALLNYLLKILRIRIATAGRKAQFESLSDGQDLVSEEPCDLTDAKDLVTTVLERFTERDQRLILLYGELSSETAVARAMGCSRSTVRRVLERFAILTRRLSGSSAIAGKGGGPCRVGK